MKWHKVSEKPFPIQETFIAGFEVIKNGNSFFEPCVVYCRDYDSEIIDVFNDCPCGWDDKDITYWAEYSEPQEFKEAETQPITQAKAAEALPVGEIAYGCNHCSGQLGEMRVWNGDKFCSQCGRQLLLT